MGKFKKGHVPWNKKKKDPIDWRIVAVAILAIAAINIVCILKGMNGTILSICIGLIGALAGLNLPQLKLRRH
ncbi:hypothetical protein ES703_91831 [subsurface metagenome]